MEFEQKEANSGTAMGEDLGAVDVDGQDVGRGVVVQGHEVRGAGEEGAEHGEVGSVVSLTPFLFILVSMEW